MRASTAQQLRQLRHVRGATSDLRGCSLTTTAIVATARAALAEGYALNASAQENMVQTADTLSTSDDMMAQEARPT